MRVGLKMAVHEILMASCIFILNIRHLKSKAGSTHNNCRIRSDSSIREVSTKYIGLNKKLNK